MICNSDLFVSIVDSRSKYISIKLLMDSGVVQTTDLCFLATSNLVYNRCISINKSCDWDAEYLSKSKEYTLFMMILEKQDLNIDLDISNNALGTICVINDCPSASNSDSSGQITVVLPAPMII